MCSGVSGPPRGQLPDVITVIISRILRWAEHVGRLKYGRNAFKILTGYPIGERPLGRPSRRWLVNLERTLKIDVMQGISLICLRIEIIG
jgi:hypothetical protein